jgi:hypothetical protein
MAVIKSGASTDQLTVDATSKAARTTVYDTDGSPISSINAYGAVHAFQVAQSATDFVVSSLNSTTAQLVAAATFTGTVETAFNQQSYSILLTTDQPGTLTILQYIDAAGLRLSSTLTYPVVASVPFSRSGVINGNYIKVTFQNTGLATTTTLNLNTAYGTIPSVSALNNMPVSIDEVSGIAITARADGVLKVSGDPSTLFIDQFESLNTTDNWTTGGSVAPTAVTGTLTVAAGTPANNTSFISSKPTFVNGAAAFLQYAIGITLDAGIVTGNRRFWGIGTLTTPTLSVPIVNGSIFEIDDTTGLLKASVYVNSVKTGTISLVRPTDGGLHRYSILYRSTRVYFELDGVQVGSIAYPNPQVNLLSLVLGSVNGASILGANATLTASFVSLGDTGKNASQIADATTPWKKAGVQAKNTQSAFALAVQAQNDTGRNVTNYFMPLQIITTAGDVLQTLTGYKSGAAVAGTTTPAVVTTGKTFRITSITMSYVATATIGSAQFTLRANTAGVVAIGSPAVANWLVGAGTATAGANQTLMVDYPNGLEFAAGTGIGISVIGRGATGTAAIVGYALVAIEGFEY